MRNYMRLHHGYYYPNYDQLRLLVDIDPSTILRIIRQTRPPGVRKDEQETEPLRIDIIARAHHCLGRAEKEKRIRKLKHAHKK